MAGPRVLFVKLSSLGDVVHNFPAVTDVVRHYPGAHIGWAVEEAYAELVRLHPGVAEAIPVSLRRWRRHWLQPASWSELRKVKAGLRAHAWDYVIDTQGLIKSATVSRWARGPRFGPDRASARESVAARAYDVKLRVPRAMHAVERNRLLVAQVFGYAAAPEPDYGIGAPAVTLPWLPTRPYVVFLHGASHERKRWREERWIELGRHLAERGYALVLPGGSAQERQDAARMAAAIPDALAAPSLTLVDAAALLSGASAVCGVDTGLTHLAAALGTPTVGIYVATQPELTGLHAPLARNVAGGRGGPAVDAVMQALFPAAA